MKAYSVPMSLVLVLAAGCHDDSETALSRSQHLVSAVDQGMQKVGHEQGHVEEGEDIPFGDIVSGFDSEMASTLPPGEAELSPGGPGGPEIGSGGPGAPELGSGGSGSPEVPPGGLGTPAGSPSFAGAVCEFIDAICDKVVVCLAAEFESDPESPEANCDVVQAECLPFVQQALIESQVTQIPPAAITYLNCVTVAIRGGTCSIFEEEGFIEPIEACLPAGITLEPTPDDQTGDGV